MKEKIKKKELVIDITTQEIKEFVKEFMNDLNIITIPANCYMDTYQTPNSEKYEIFYDGEKINDVYGIIRFSPQFTNNDKGKKIITNWQKEFEEE